MGFILQKRGGCLTFISTKCTMMVSFFQGLQIQIISAEVNNSGNPVNSKINNLLLICITIF